MSDIRSLKEFIPSASSKEMESFEAFYFLVEKYNSKINLISKSSLPRAAAKHFSDSYLGLKIISDHLIPEKPVFDFGAGNGFPGIIAGIMFTDREFILVERDQRKSEFIKLAADHLGLKNLQVHGGNVSDLSDGSCFNVISRAMAPIPKFLLEARSVVAPGGKALLFKGDYWSTEFSAIPAQLFEFWDVDLLGDYQLPNDEGSRFIINCSRF